MLKSKHSDCLQVGTNLVLTAFLQLDKSVEEEILPFLQSIRPPALEWSFKFEWTPAEVSTHGGKYLVLIGTQDTTQDHLSLVEELARTEIHPIVVCAHNTSKEWLISAYGSGLTKFFDLSNELGEEEWCPSLSHFVQTQLRNGIKLPLLELQGQDLASVLLNILPESVGIWQRTNNDIRAIYVNEAAMKVSNGRFINNIGKTAEEVYAHDPIVLESLKRAFLSGRESLKKHYYSRLNEIDSFLHFEFVKVHNYVFSFARDLSEYKYKQEHLQIEKETLVDLIQEVLHDGLNIASTLKGLTHLAREESRQEIYDRLQLTITHLEHILKGAQARSDVFAPVVGREINDLYELVTTAAARIIPPSIETEIRGPLPRVSCSYDQIYRVVNNLFTNAIIHGKPSKITVSGSSTTSGFSVLVKNNGKPIPNDIRAKIFQSGFSTAGSSGLGLAITKRILDSHGWEIKLQNRRITTFQIFVPSTDILGDE